MQDKSRGNDLSIIRPVSFAFHLTSQRLSCKDTQYPGYRQKKFRARNLQ